jgi:hypothetical protein
LGELTAEYLDNNYPAYLTGEWRDRVRRCVAVLKDSLEADLPHNVAATELSITLGSPVYDYPDDYIRDAHGPLRSEIEGTEWGRDIAGSVGFFVAAGISVVLGFLAFAVLVYGYNPPDRLATIAAASIGGIALSIAGTSLGWGLFRIYVTPGYFESIDDPLYGRVTRRRSPFRVVEWYVYSFACVCLSACVTLAVLVGRSFEVVIVDDYTILRLAVLATAALGLLLLAAGAWPVVLRMIIRSEINQREGRPAYAVSPRVLVAGLPALTGLTLIIINWLSQP